MKVCPTCQTQYEDHAMVCLIDAEPLHTLTLLSPATVSTTSAVTTNRTPIPPAGPYTMPPHSAGGTREFTVAVISTLVIMAAGLTLYVLQAKRNALTEPPKEPSEPTPHRLASAPPAKAPTTLLSTSPAGASVWQGNLALCDQTPCKIELPDSVKLPVLLTIRLAGYEEHSFLLQSNMKTANIPLQTLSSKQPMKVKQTTPDPVQPLNLETER